VVQLAAARLRSERVEGRREIERMVKPVADGLQTFRSRLDEIERDQVEGRTKLQEQLTALGEAQQELVAGTGALVGALRRPHVRGRWGEMTLKRVVETAGMVPHVDFIEQPTLSGEDGRMKPDLIVRIPGGKEVVVDSKAPLEAYLDACSATDEEERRQALVKHARQLREHIKKLSSKAYWEQFTTMPDFVFLFVPNDQVLAAAAEVNDGLMDELESQRVFLATPMTLMVLLRVVGVAWQQETVAESAREIWKLGRDLHRRLGKLGDRIQVLGRRLKSAVTAFNEAVGTYEGRVLPGARRFSELGPASPADTLPSPEQVLESPRILQAPEVIEPATEVESDGKSPLNEPEDEVA
jgi:DNA recombination protein RmuC